MKNILVAKLRHIQNGAVFEYSMHDVCHPFTNSSTPKKAGGWMGMSRELPFTAAESRKTCGSLITVVKLFAHRHDNETSTAETGHSVIKL